MSALLRRLLAVAAIVVAVAAASVGVASAHASLLTTTPADGGSVSADPDLVTATFSEPVKVDVGGLSVRDRDGVAVEQGTTTVDPAGTTISVDLQADLPDGTYVATYRVLSTDGHPISGSWIFGIGADADLSAGSGSPSGDGGWELVGAIARFTTYAAALIAAGVTFFVAFVHDRRPDRRRLARIVRIATPIGLVGIIGTVVAQAALLTGAGLSATTDADVVRSVLSERLGWSAAVLLLGLAAVNLSIDMRDTTVEQVLAVIGGLAITGSFALWGHDTEAPHRWLAVSSDVVHVGAAAVWFGGLVGLSVVLTRTPPYPVSSTAAIVRRFSTIAAVSVVALVVAGLAMSWVEMGALRGLWESAYGRMVLAKMALTSAVVVLAVLNRYRILPALSASLPDDDSLSGLPIGDDQAPRWRRLRRTVAVEAIVIVAVLGITAVLVNTTPARTALGTATGPVSMTKSTDDGSVTLEVVPAQVGRNTMHIQYLDAQGIPDDIATTLTVELTLPEIDVGPIERQVLKLAPGHFVLEGDELSLPGTWTITLSARTTDFTEQQTTFEVDVRR